MKRSPSRFTRGELDVLNERAKQRRKWGNKHDDEHTNGILADVAGHLACDVQDEWRLGEKIYNTRERMIVAAALCLAEIDRMDRAAKKAKSPHV